MDDTLFSNINNLYNKKTFLEKYGSDLWITIIICIIVILLMSYYYVMNHIQPIISDWNNQKCSPIVIPFAGLINKPANMTAFEFTGSNFTNCVTTILENISSDAFAPIEYIMNVFIHEFKSIVDAMDAVRAIFDKIRVSMQTVIEDVMSRLLNIMIPVQQFIILMKDMLAKVNGALTGILYTVFGSYLTLRSLFSNIINLVLIILLILAGIIAGLLIISFIPIIGIPAEIAVVPMIAVMISVVLVTVSIEGLMSDVFQLPTRAPPNIPGCFAKDTLIQKSNGDFVTINDIQVGDQLMHNKSNTKVTGTKVTGLIKFSATEQHMYNLNNVLVTGEHRVYHNSLGWIKVKNHPESKPIDDFQEHYVYCLLTSSKVFQIGETIYSDWDDIDINVLEKLIKNCPYLPDNFKSADIHPFIDNGLGGNSQVELFNGTLKNLKDIQVNDCLKNGEFVVGTVKIDAFDLQVGKYILWGREIICSKNITFFANEIGANEMGANANANANEMGANEMGANANEIDPMSANANEIDPMGANANEMGAIGANANEIDPISINTFELLDMPLGLPDPYLYQLLTTSGSFEVNGLMCKDYNYGIDQYTF